MNKSVAAATKLRVTKESDVWDNSQTVAWFKACLDFFIFSLKGHIRISDLGLAVRLMDGKLVHGRVGTLGYMGTYMTQIWCHFHGNQLIPEVRHHTSLWFQLLRWSAASIMGWALTGGALAASFMKWQPESLRSEPTENTPARRIWSEGSRWARRNMEKSSALKWNKSVHWWVWPAQIRSQWKAARITGFFFSFQLQLLTKNPKHRLGCQSSAGRDVQSHPFFQKINFRMLKAGLVEPPFKPDVSACLPACLSGWSAFRILRRANNSRVKSRV